MFETDRLPKGWAERLNKMDWVWVPTAFHLDVFKAGGVVEEKLVVVPEAVDTVFFDPHKARPFTWPHAKSDKKEMIFFSVFKWEERKGWRFLIESFVREFDEGEPVALYILTNAYHTDSDFEAKISQYLSTLDLPSGKVVPPIRLLPSGISQAALRDAYAAADVFVLPSRGEGWGRPHVEAMAMGLPLISTFWSGPTEYMTQSNSYPLDIDGLEEISEGAFRGHMWAKPSITHLRALFREVFENPSAAKAKGKAARASMEEHYSPSRVSALIVDILRNIPLSARKVAKSEL